MIPLNNSTLFVCGGNCESYSYLTTAAGYFFFFYNYHVCVRVLTISDQLFYPSLRSGTGESHAQMHPEASEACGRGGSTQLPGEQWSLAAAEGEPGIGQNQTAARDGCRRSHATRPCGHREDSPKVPQYEQDVLT